MDFKEIEKYDISKATEKDKELASILHKHKCHWNHTEGCAWYYDKPEDFSGWTKKEYLINILELKKKFTESELDILLKILKELK